MKKDNKKILLELLQDGRKNISDIAEELDISRQTVSKKIKEMEEEGIIKSFTPNLNENLLDLRTKAYIILEIAPCSELRHEFVQEAKDMENISQIHHTFGRFDMVLEVLVEGDKELDEILDKVRDFEAVEETETLICKYTEKNKPEDPFRTVLE
ncbi:MAG: Lrp/AsnC family transcriptional regulator [Candidatus Aenigmatarchaeota archaeon]